MKAKLTLKQKALNNIREELEYFRKTVCKGYHNDKTIYYHDTEDLRTNLHSFYSYVEAMSDMDIITSEEEKQFCDIARFLWCETLDIEWK